MNEDEKLGSKAKTTPFVKTFPINQTKHVGIFDLNKSHELHSGLITLQPGESVGEHSTEDHEELVIALSGNGELEAEGLGTVAFGEGQVAYNPPHTRHNIFNTSDKPFKYIYVVTKVL